MLKINIVCSDYDSNTLRYCRFFKQNLGLTITKMPTYSDTVKHQTKDRIINTDDEFAYNYSKYYNRHLFAFGNIQLVKVYYDLHIKKNEFRVYINQEEYIHNLNYDLNSYNIDATIVRIISESKAKFENKDNLEEKRTKEFEEKFLEQEKSFLVGDETKLWNNPGVVNAKDVYEYLKKRNLLDTDEKLQRFKYN